jgi:hypothetical protein
LEFGVAGKAGGIFVVGCAGVPEGVQDRINFEDGRLDFGFLFGGFAEIA